MSKCEFEKSVDLAQEIASMVKGINTFDLCIDDTGGYIEIDGVTVHFDENLESTHTEVSL